MGKRSEIVTDADISNRYVDAYLGVSFDDPTVFEDRDVRHEALTIMVRLFEDALILLDRDELEMFKTALKVYLNWDESSIVKSSTGDGRSLPFTLHVLHRVTGISKPKLVEGFRKIIHKIAYLAELFPRSFIRQIEEYEK